MRKYWTKQKNGASLFKLFSISLLALFFSGFLFFAVVYKGEAPHIIHRGGMKQTQDAVDFRREIASQLADIAMELNNPKKIVSPHIPLRLNKVVGMLDPSFTFQKQDFLRHHENEMENDKEEVCGEVFKGSRYGYPFFQEGFVAEPCDYARPLSDLITVLINAVGYSDGKLRKLYMALQGTQEYNDNMLVLVASDSNQTDFVKKFKNARVVRFRKESGGRVWNGLVRNVRTPYTLIAKDIMHFNSYARLERQIRVISSVKSVGVAGGAFRNITGYWKVGCYQTDIKNFFLKYFEGYRYSSEDCMYCDYLEGPFVARTSILHQIPFSEELPKEVVIENWFLKVKQANILVVNCPDVMYFTWGIAQGVKTKRISWVSLARQWGVNRVFIPPNTLHFFSCKEVGLTCKIALEDNQFLLPSCCMIQMARGLKAIDSFSEERALRYEVKSDLVLGAVKFRSFSPWHLSGNIAFNNTDFDTYHKAEQWFQKKGFKLDSFHKSKNSSSIFNFHMTNMNFEMRGTNELSSKFLPHGLHDIPTKVNVHGIWVKSQTNPGLYVRNRYGPNYLKHLQSVMQFGMADDIAKQVLPTLFPCSKKTQHVCLMHYSLDGNTDFVQQFLH